MANADAKIEDELSMTCCLGNHPLQNPRLLPCNHSFCLECIKNGIREEKKEFMCPKCQLSIPLTEEKADQLPENILYHIIQETKGNDTCIVCKFQGKKTSGSFQCLDCADVLCDQCQSGHTNSSLTISHRVVSVKDIQQGKYKSEPQPQKELLCDRHSKPNTPMVLEYYCEQCKCLACQLCALREHVPQGHTCNTLHEIHDEKKTAVTDHVTKLLGLKQNVEEFAELLEQELRHNAVDKEKLENEVHDRATKLIELIEKVKEETLEKFKSHFDTENTSIQTKLNESKNRILRIESLVSYTQAFLKHSGRSHFLEHGNEMMEKLIDSNPQKKDLTLKTNIIDIGDLQFEEIQSCVGDALGNIKIKRKKLAKIGLDITLELMKKPNILFCEDSGISEAFGLAVAYNNDIVAVGGSSIQKYNSEGRLKDSIRCSQLQEAWDVVAKDDILYISNGEQDGNILTVDFKGNVKKIITLPNTREISRVHNKGLAVADDGTIYISLSSMSTIYKCEPYETNAKVFIQQTSNGDLKIPMNLCVTPGGELVVSNRGSSTVQAYDRAGEFLWQYRGQGDMKIRFPRGVCCDRQGYIYICDYGNNRIQVIKDEVFKGCIQMKDFPEPRCIDIDDDDNIVCGYANGTKIVKMKVWE